MSIGNLKDNGNKGNNFPYQLAVLKLLGSINSGIAVLPGVDYETRTTMYQATAGGAGYSIGDIIIRYDIIDVATSTVTATIWFNQTTQAVIAAPVPGDITPIAAPSSVTVINGAGGAAVNIQDGGNSITVDSTTLASQATLALIQALLTTIDVDTSNLDVLLSTRASEVTTAAINTKLTPATRTHNSVVSTGVGSVPIGSLRGSVLNSGNAAATWNGISLPAGVGMAWGDIFARDTYAAINYDATGTTFIIEYTT